MADFLTPEARSERMARIRGKNTTPEMIVRRELHSRGYRYRVHGNPLPGSPDLVFPARKKALWVHGCFWHFHQDPCCPIAKLPKSRTDYWLQKFARNGLRDERVARELLEMGWGAFTIWECQLRKTHRQATLAAVEAFLRA
ncbi:very short patch repair endonuclease [Allosphingosinicella sp.]|uniref:very short patch repair endonuclease n=1 Tax=Allosphingosinicella sp. TaxID=2823234 RepID=UPI002EF8032B